MSSLFSSSRQKNPHKFIFFIVLGGLSLLLAGALSWLFLGTTALESSSLSYSAPLLKPDYETFKIKAPNPGGSTILHQDKEIYNQLIKKEGILEAPEEDFSSFPDEASPLLEERPEASETKMSLPPALESLYTHDSDAALPKEESSKSWSDIFETLLDQGIESSPPSSYCVSLPPSITKERAHMEWRRLRANNIKLLQNLPMTLSRNEKLDGKIQFQIQIGVFKSQSEAETICLSLHHKKVPCTVTEIPKSFP